jgi:hypothetical protein
MQELLRRPERLDPRLRGVHHALNDDA